MCCIEVAFTPTLKNANSQALLQSVQKSAPQVFGRRTSEDIPAEPSTGELMSDQEENVYDTQMLNTAKIPQSLH